MRKHDRRSGRIATDYGRGIIPASLIHFPMSETYGQKITDVVSGAYLDFSLPPFNDNRLAHTVAKAVSTVGANGVNRYTSSGTLGMISSGVYCQYGVANWNANGCVCSLGDIGTGTPPIGIEANTTTTSLWVGQDSPLNFSYSDVLSGANHFLTLGKVSYVFVVPFNSPGAGADLYCYGSNGAFTHHVANTAGWTDTTSWDMTQLRIGLRNVDAFVLGALNFKVNAPTAQNYADCAAWHYTNAPLGDKRVWPGWAGYS